MTYLTFEKDGKLLYIGEGGSGYHLPLFRNHSEAFEYASRYSVKFHNIVPVRLSTDTPRR